MTEGTGREYEVVISFSEGDLEFVRKLAGDLSAGGLNVWYADSTKYDARALVNEKGKAVTACKVFVVILSETSCKDDHVNDELALAYISNSTIFPVGLVRIKKLSESMESGMKLMLAKINWIFFVKDAEYDENMPLLLGRINDDIFTKQEHTPPITESTDASPFQILNAFTHINFEPVDDTQNEHADFWERNFGDKNDVTWVDFKGRFLYDYGEKITEMYDKDKERFFINLMYKDIFDLAKTIRRTVYTRFCSEESADPDHFFNRLQDYGRGMYAMRQVFDMDSTLRITAVQNLGKFSTPQVVNELLRMMDDEDANIRAVAAVALARSGKDLLKAVDRLTKKLKEDDDRIVRESICFSLGYMQAKNAVFTILDVWRNDLIDAFRSRLAANVTAKTQLRNDPIASVRAAAEATLKMLNCDEAREAIYLTEVLNSEITDLQKPATAQ